MEMRLIYRRGIILSLLAVITVIFLLKKPSNVTRIETTIPVQAIFKKRTTTYFTSERGRGIPYTEDSSEYHTEANIRQSYQRRLPSLSI